MNNNQFKLQIFTTLIFILMINPELTLAQTVSKVLWQQGTGKYNNYRIPSIMATQQGTLLAFCEGREAGDTGDIDILLKRSEDNGKTWSEEMVVWDDGLNTCGNPCPVVDEETGRIWLFLTWNNGKDHERDIINKRSQDTRWPYLCYSDDDGKTWSEPEKIPGLKNASWGWYATGPGIGIQLKRGHYKGRLVIPANHSYDDPEGNIHNGPYGFGSHVLFSEDNGETWKMSEPIRPGCNESQVAELSDGTLVMNMRSYNNQYSRAVAFSKDGGKSWSEIEHDFQLVESKCQASLLNFGEYKKENLYLFSNPAVPVGRTAMTIKTSFDNCDSWSNSKLVYAGPSAYSCLVKLPNDKVGLFFEVGEKRPYEKMVFVSFKIKELFTPGTILEKI
jgi:sialidase-1